MGLGGGGGPQDFSVSPRPFGFGFETKGLGPGLDNSKISYKIISALCLVCAVQILVVIVNVVHVLRVLHRLVLQVLEEGSVVTDHHSSGCPGLTSIDHTHGSVLLFLTVCKVKMSSLN